MKARPSSFAIRLLPLAILITTQCLLTAALQIVYVDERASYLPGRPCGGSADEPCPTLADAFGGSHLLKSTDYEVRIRPGVYRASENVGFVFTDSSISLKRWPEESEQRVVFDCEHGPASFAFKDCSASSLTGIELRHCPTVLVAGSTGFTVTDAHFLDGKPLAPTDSRLARRNVAQSAAMTGGSALMVTHTTGLVVQDSVFVNHTARPGGALFVDASEGVQLRRLQIRSGGGIFIAACKDKTTLSDATLIACSSGGKGGAIHVVGSELVVQRVAITPNKRTSVRCEGQASVIDVDGTLLLSKACTNSDTNRPHSERDTRLSSAPQNVAHAAVVLVMFILGLNWVLEGLEARW